MHHSALNAHKNLAEKKRLVELVDDIRSAELSENRLAYEKFFNNLALFAGGTIALSVTYLGYLKAQPAPVSHSKYLIASWISLLICVVFALFYSYSYSHYRHFGRNREYSERKKEMYESEIENLSHLQYANIQTRDDYEVYETKLKAAAANWATGVRWHGKREKLFEFLYRWIAPLAQLSFVIGLILLMMFAIVNMNISSPAQIETLDQH